MAKKKRKPAPDARRGRGGAPAPADIQSAQRGAQAMFFVAIAFVAGHEGIIGLADPVRTYALWALAIIGSLLGLMRRADAVTTIDLCLSLAARARSGVLFAIVACAALAISGAGNREHGLFANSTADAALVGCLVFAAAMLAWGGASSAVGKLLGNPVVGIVTGAIVFTMTFFTGSISADVAVLVASFAGAVVSQRTRSIGFASIVFSFGVGGVPAAIVTSALYVAISAARLR